MNLRTATPAKIDEMLAELETAWFAQQNIAERAMDTLRYVVRDTRSAWYMTTEQVQARVAELQKDTRPDYRRFNGYSAEDVTKALDKIEATKVEKIRLEGEIKPLEDEYRRRPWSRFFQLRSTDGARIHDNRLCGGLHRSDHGDLGWHPELSGKSEAEAVAELGPVMCSKCFRSAPVEWKRDPADLKVNPNACPGAEQRPVEGTRTFVRSYSGGYDEAKCTGCDEMKRLRADYTIGKHDKPKIKINEITAPDGVSPLRVGGETIKTVRTAEINYTDDAAYLAACKAGYRGTGRVQEATEHVKLILEALAAKNGTTVQAERDRLAPKVAKKAKQYL